MTDLEQEERRSALDEFAALSSSREIASYQPLPTGAMAIFEPPRGAIPVAVARDEQEFIVKIKQFAAYNGEHYYYRYPVRNRKENRTDFIEGPSVKLANDLWRLWKNCEVDVRVIDLGDHWMIYSRFNDLEAGVTMTLPFPQPKNSARLGGDDEGRRLQIAMAIGTAKSRRNVIVNALQTYAEIAFQEAKQSLVNKIGKDLDGWRKRTAEKVAAHLDIARVEFVINRKATEWLAPDVAKVIAMMKSVQDGFSSLDETFPPLSNQQTAEDSASQLDSFARTGKAGADPEAPAHQGPNPAVGRADEEGNGAAGEDELPLSNPAVDLFSEIERRMAGAETPDAVQAVWDQMDLDARLEDDAAGRGKANKLMSKRLRELK